MRLAEEAGVSRFELSLLRRKIGVEFDSEGTYDEGWDDAIEAAREAFEHGPLRARLAPFHADVDGAFWQWNDIWLSPDFRSYDIRQEIASISAPLLAIQGEDDPYGTLAQIDDIAAAVPHAQLLKLAQCGHSPHRDQPEAVAQAIADFLISRARTV